MPPPVVGIDLGTTFSLAAFVRDGRPEVVRDERGAALVPSVLSFHDDGTVLVGSAARDRALSDPQHTIFSVKRLMGRTLKDLEKELKLIPHQIIERDAGEGRKVLHVRIGGREYTPEELSALILKEVRRRAGNPTASTRVDVRVDDVSQIAPCRAREKMPGKIELDCLLPGAFSRGRIMSRGEMVTRPRSA